ncbi:MAG: T9SS type A sorting domain-containing protein [bacterium]|nr:T9SS type A sorting domain-containing protein [bacterium]
MRFLICLLAILILSSTSQAGTYQVVYQQQLPGAENYVHVDPIVSEDGLLAGFIYCDSANQQVVIERYGVDTNLVIDYDRRPVKSINYVAGDSVVVYVLLHSAPVIADLLGFQLGKLALNQGSLFDTVVTTPVPMTFGGIIASAGWCSVLSRDISFSRTGDGITGLVYESSSNDHFYYGTMGWADEFREIHKLYDLNLVGLRHSIRARVGRYGNLQGTDEQEQAFFRRHWYSYDFSDPGYPNAGSSDNFRVWVEDSTSILAGRDYSDGCNGYALFVDEFSPIYEYDEMIFYGYAEDLLGLHNLYGDKKSHVACYRFSDTGVTENWYTEISGITLDYVYEPQHYIAGFHGPDRVIAFNYWSGTLCDSIDLDRTLSEPTFFELGDSPSLLSLTGRVGDTILIYQFQTPTDADEPGTPPNLPSGFALHQNYPNPFNNETVLTFANDTRQHLTLSVYNVLGQKIAVLHDQPTSAGEHSVSWNGTDDCGREVASGIYFARLRSENGSTLVKMILLK